MLIFFRILGIFYGKQRRKMSKYKCLGFRIFIENEKFVEQRNSQARLLQNVKMPKWIFIQHDAMEIFRDKQQKYIWQ